LGPGSYFGEEEIFSLSPRISRVTILSSTAEIYKCTNEKFFAYVKTQHNINLFKKNINLKTEWRDNYVDQVKRILGDRIKKESRTQPTDRSE
jgi:CRP-like cAMP-binding protein